MNTILAKIQIIFIQILYFFIYIIFFIVEDNVE